MLSRQLTSVVKAGLLVLLLALDVCTRAAPPVSRRNILLIIGDDIGIDSLALYNDDPSATFPPTPALDALAGRGVLFTRAYANPTCSPTRAAILTGLLPLSNGVYDNGVDLDPAVGAGGFAGRLADSGYDTAFIGKAHFASRRTFGPTGTPGLSRSSSCR